MKVCALAVSLLLALPMRAQEISTTIVPVVGNVFGASMDRWLTDVQLINDTGLPIDLALELPSAPSEPIMFTLTPGETKHYVDVTAEAFGLNTALSPLRITSNTRRGVTVRAFAYAVGGGRVSPMQNIAVYTGSTYFPVRILDGLAFSTAYRTNVGLVNLGDEPAEFLLALQRLPGRNLAIKRMNVNPGALVHVAIQALFPVIERGEGFSIVIETNARDTHVYASVIESATNAARFIAPRVGAR